LPKNLPRLKKGCKRSAFIKSPYISVLERNVSCISLYEKTQKKNKKAKNFKTETCELSLM